MTLSCKNFNFSQTIEYRALSEIFENFKLIDNNTANFIINHIYSIVRESIDQTTLGSIANIFSHSDRVTVEYRTRYSIKDGEYREYYPNGKLSVQTTFVNGELNGEYREWYRAPNNSPIARDRGQLSTYKNYVGGKLHGEYKNWYANAPSTNDTNSNSSNLVRDMLHIQTTYVNGNLHGEYKKWFQNGNVWIETTYKDNVYHGEFRQNHKNGQPYIVCTYKDGKKHGEYKEYNDNGQLIFQYQYVDGLPSLN